MPVLNVSLNLCCNASLKPLNNETAFLLTRGLRSLQSEPDGWNARIAPNLGVIEVLALTLTLTLTITLTLILTLTLTLTLAPTLIRTLTLTRRS